jgi:hypothetical protein
MAAETSEVMQRGQTSSPRFLQACVAFARHAVAPINGMKPRRRREWKIAWRLRETPGHHAVQKGRAMLGQPSDIPTPDAGL